MGILTRCPLYSGGLRVYEFKTKSESLDDPEKKDRNFQREQKDSTQSSHCANT